MYSRVVPNADQLLEGLYCKVGSSLGNDWVEQDLLTEFGFPNNKFFKVKDSEGRIWNQLKHTIRAEL